MREEELRRLLDKAFQDSVAALRRLKADSEILKQNAADLAESGVVYVESIRAWAELLKEHLGEE